MFWDALQRNAKPRSQFWMFSRCYRACSTVTVFSRCCLSILIFASCGPSTQAHNTRKSVCVGYDLLAFANSATTFKLRIKLIAPENIATFIEPNNVLETSWINIVPPLIKKKNMRARTERVKRERIPKNNLYVAVTRYSHRYLMVDGFISKYKYQWETAVVDAFKKYKCRAKDFSQTFLLEVIMHRKCKTATALSPVPIVLIRYKDFKKILKLLFYTVQLRLNYSTCAFLSA